MRVAWDQQVVIDTSAGTEAHKTIPEDPGPTGSSPGMYSGRSFWLVYVSQIAVNMIGTPPLAGNKANGTPTLATASAALIPVTGNHPHPQEIPAGTVISAIAQGGAAVPGAKVSFIRCYP